MFSYQLIAKLISCHLTTVIIAMIYRKKLSKRIIGDISGIVEEIEIKFYNYFPTVYAIKFHPVKSKLELDRVCRLSNVSFVTH